MVSFFVTAVSWNHPLGSLDSDGGFKIGFSCIRVPSSYKTTLKWSQNDEKDFQYYDINIKSDTVLMTLWAQAQTHLRVPLPDLCQHPSIPKHFFWAAGWREADWIWTYLLKWTGDIEIGIRYHPGPLTSAIRKSSILGFRLGSNLIILMPEFHPRFQPRPKGPTLTKPLPFKQKTLHFQPAWFPS